MSTQFKVGSIVVNSSGTFAKVLKIVGDVHICTRWAETPDAIKTSTVSQSRFNAGAIKSCGIKLATKGSKPENGTDTNKKTPAPAPKALTAEEQAELDAMIDFTVTKESLKELNANLPDGMAKLRVGDVVKLSPDHALLKK